MKTSSKRPADPIVAVEPVCVPPRVAGQMLGCGRTTTYALMKSGQLEVVRIGADFKVTVKSIKRVGGGA